MMYSTTVIPNKNISRAWNMIRRGCYIVFIFYAGVADNRRYFQQAHVTNIGCRKKRRVLMGPWGPYLPA